MTRLSELANLILDAQLAKLQVMARAKQDSEIQLAGLAAAVAPAIDLSGLTGQRAAVQYQRWADIRRTELNLVLARQTAAWMDARVSASLAFGKAEALKSIAENLKRQIPRD